MTELTLEVGKCYRTRDGRKARVSSEGINYPFVHVDGEDMPQGYRWNGKWGCNDTYGNDEKALDLVAEWVDEPEETKLWGDWQSARGWEKDNDWLERIPVGHLEVMITTGEKIVINHFMDMPKAVIVAYRVKPEPKRETVKLPWGSDFRDSGVYTHRITFDTIDGVPDCSTVRMEEV